MTILADSPVGLQHRLASEDHAAVRIRSSKRHSFRHASQPSRRSPELPRLLAEIAAMVPPVWPLQDYVAVNPFLGLSEKTLLDARKELRAVRNCELLMPLKHYRNLFERGEVHPQDVSNALAECQRDDPVRFSDLTVSSIADALNRDPVEEDDARTVWNVAELVDLDTGGEWSSHIVNDVTRHCAAHFDAGQANWSSPWNDRSLYAAWKAASTRSLRMEWLGISGFRRFVQELPDQPLDVIAELLDRLEIPEPARRDYLACLLFSVAGWASFVAYRARAAGDDKQELAGLLAIRLAYDAALAESAKAYDTTRLWKSEHARNATRESLAGLTRYVLQVAVEIAYRRRLCGALTSHPAPVTVASRKLVQMVFCIDVRSEILRRHLESITESIETFGFAGFFGMPLEYIPLGSEQGTAQCPVLLQPRVRIHGRALGVAPQVEAAVEQRTRSDDVQRSIWRSFQTSATSCFSYVESMGLLSLGKLISDSCGWTRSADANGRGHRAAERPRVGPALGAHGAELVPLETRIELAEGMLRNLGLTDRFARLVVLCGHASEVTNNPYQAALDCGACGGHSGEPNARVAAMLLNQSEVREALTDRGIEIPEDTLFLAAVHKTTTDDVVLCDAEDIPASHQDDVRRLFKWTTTATRLTRQERCKRLSAASGEALPKRSRDWAEVQPEWGLAGNAAFIVAPRSKTRMLPLAGRTFLHSYDYRQDPDLRVLELIMTAPMVVTNWINLQYYASAVDQEAFGSGNKAIHNVVGRFGVLEGNGGDLRTGLPWPCVHDGREYQHKPLRLLVVIAAPRAAIERILERHEAIRHLAANHWLSLVAWDEEEFFRWSGQGVWEELAVDAIPNLQPSITPFLLQELIDELENRVVCQWRQESLT